MYYIILRVGKERTLKRAVERLKLDRKTNIELVEAMWEQFYNLGIYESNVVDTTNHSIQEIASAVQEKIVSRTALLSQIVLMQFPFIEQMKLRSRPEAAVPKDKIGDVKVMNNEYDNEEFFEEYVKMSRGKEGLKAADEWRQLKPLSPSLKGKSVFDLGCRYGWHCGFAEEQGATKILGTDLSKKIIEEAQKCDSGDQIEYHTSGLEEYDYPENEWDCVISNLALHYIEDMVETFQKVYRTLRPGGIFLPNIEHPVLTAGAGQDWIYTDDGKPQYRAIGNYFITGERNIHFLGCDVAKQYHTFTQIIMGLLNNGLELKVVKEADFLEELDSCYNEEGVSELDKQFERSPDEYEAKRSYYLGLRQA